MQLNVVMLIDAWFPFYGGGQVHVKNLSSVLQEKFNCKVKVFHPNSSKFLDRLVWSFTVVFQVFFYSFFHKVDIIHSHGFVTGISAKVLSLLTRKPCVHTVHGSHLMDKGESGFKSWLEKTILTKIVYSAEITVSSSFNQYPNVNNPIVIRNGVNLTDFDQVNAQKHKNPTIIFVGRNHPDKGVDTLHKAFELVKMQIPNAKLSIVSGGSMFGQKLVEEYKKSHVFVLPSLAEGQPIALLEAWAAGLPVIVTKVGDNPNMVTKDNGFLINIGDYQTLSDKIVFLINNSQTAKKMGESGYNLVKEKYTWDTVAAKTFKIYQGLI